MDDEDEAVARPNRRWWWIAGGVAIIVAAVITIGSLTGWGNGAPESGASPTTSPASSQGTGVDDDTTTKPTPSATSAPGDDADEEPEPRTTTPPVGLDETAEPTEDLRVTLSGIAEIEGTASVPGEVEGPALQVSVEVENVGSSTASTDTMIVNVYYGPDRTPANILVRPRQDFPLTVEAGDTERGVFAYSVPADSRDDIVVEVDMSVDLPVVLFEGAVS